MAWRRSERLIVVVHGARNPPDVEWQAFLNDCVATRLGPSARILVVSHGGHPDAGQRGQLARAIGSPARTALLTRSALVRAAALALRFFNPHMVALGLDQSNAAAQHLGLSTRERDVVLRYRRELELELALVSDRPFA